MIVAVLVPRFPLLIAIRRSGVGGEGVPVALGPQPGAPQVVGLCTAEAEAQGVRPGLRLGEALARCPALELVAPDPDATADAADALIARLESIGAAVEQGPPGLAWFAADGLLRLHGGIHGVVRRARAALPVGVDGRIGVAPTRFAATQAARCSSGGQARLVDHESIRALLFPLPVDLLAEDGEVAPEVVATILDIGVSTLGRLADLPRRDLAGRLGPAGERAWRHAAGLETRPVRPRTPPQPIEASFEFPDEVGARSALEAAARLLIEEIAGLGRAHGHALRSLGLRARLADGGSWSRDVVLREASVDPRRLLTAALPALSQVEGPVASLLVRADASGALAGHQLSLARAPIDERGDRAREAARQVSATLGAEAVLRAVELEPWSRLPERRWALVPYER